MSFYDFLELLNLLIHMFLNSKCFIPTMLIIILSIAFFAYKNRKKTKYVSLTDINAFNITVKINMRNIDIAYRMFIELKTRKISIPFEQDDVIVEVYDSWYSSFSVIRELLQSVRPIPQNKELINVGHRLLNEGLRPHLTKWQARFRRWYEIEMKKEENLNLTPQDIQRKYPNYLELIEDLKRSQKETLIFIEKLERIFS